MSKQVWITEEEAAKKLNRHPRYLRQLVKQGTFDISYRTLNGRSYQYDDKGIEKLLLKNARIVA